MSATARDQKSERTAVETTFANALAKLLFCFLDSLVHKELSIPHIVQERAERLWHLEILPHASDFLFGKIVVLFGFFRFV